MNAEKTSAPATVPSQLSEGCFEWLRSRAYQLWGLNISPKKRTLVENRMLSLGRRTGIGRPDEVVEAYRHGSKVVTDLVMFDVLSTNLTSFFRDPVHFEILTEHVIRPWVASRTGQLRIWSAGCSSGCEPYSIGIRIHEELDRRELGRVEILATDYASSVLREAKRGVYDQRMVAGLPQETLQRHFLRGRGEKAGRVRVRPHVRSLVRFQLLNLMEPWQLNETYDAIFCRNVMIYFDAETQQRLVHAFAERLKPEGVLFLGSSENIARGSAPLQSVGHSAYRKVSAEESGSRP